MPEDRGTAPGKDLGGVGARPRQHVPVHIEGLSLGRATSLRYDGSKVSIQRSRVTKVSVFQGSERCTTFVLGEGPCTIGRMSGCDIVLPMPDVSREHAVLTPMGEAIRIEDRSRHGIWVNEQKVRSALLEVGDSVRIGGYVLRLEFEGEEEAEHADDRERLSMVETLDTSAGSRASGLGEMIGSSEPMMGVYEEVRRLSRSTVPILILGETGTGKELIARALHALGPRPDGPWVAVNCAAISPELVESELFGHERGAYTGAEARRQGAFESARGGTLFLDEIGEMPPRLQPKLLRVLESAQFQRVGGSAIVTTDARVIAATNRNLTEDVAAGRFRQDLYFRLCVYPLSLPPLRERGKDALPIARHFLAEEGAATRIAFTKDAERLLLSYAWPGNVRELRNAMRRLVAGGTTGPVDAAMLRLAIQADRTFRPSAPPPASPEVSAGSGGPGNGGSREGLRARGRERSATLRDVERETILRALQDCRWNKQEAARRLGIATSTLFEKIRRYNMSEDAPPPLPHDRTKEER